MAVKHCQRCGSLGFPLYGTVEECTILVCTTALNVLRLSSFIVRFKRQCAGGIGASGQGAFDKKRPQSFDVSCSGRIYNSSWRLLVCNRGMILCQVESMQGMNVAADIDVSQKVHGMIAQKDMRDNSIIIRQQL